jgi:hypothetical protein
MGMHEVLSAERRPSRWQRLRATFTPILVYRVGRGSDPDSGASGVREPRRPILPSLHGHEVLQPAGDDEVNLP